MRCKSKIIIIQMMYHADWNDYKRNGYPKAMMDVSRTPSDPVLTEPCAFNPHQPSKRSRNHMTMHHYLRAARMFNIGSWERFNSRNETRRSLKVWWCSLCFLTPFYGAVFDSPGDFLSRIILYLGVDHPKR